MLKNSSRNKFQWILSGSIFISSFLGFIVFSIIAENYVYQNTLDQTLKDNKMIGETMIKFFELKFRTLQNTSDSLLIDNFQSACDEFKLPNEGYICFARNNGDLVAAPGLPKGFNYNFIEKKASFIDLKRRSNKTFNELEKGATFEGFYEYPSSEHSEVIVSMPVTKEFRILVHQNNDSLHIAANKHFYTFLFLGGLGAILSSAIVFLISRRIIGTYESQIEIKNNSLNHALLDIQEKNKHINEQQRKISDSIRYAKRIQEAVFPQKEEMDAVLGEYFILSKPKDVVSGDFYWLTKKENRIIIALGDCTGHGVPGAFMSLIANDLLEKIIKLEGIYSPDKILEQLHKDIRKTLRQSSTQRPDGLDIAIVVIDTATHEIHIASAMSQVYVVIDGVLQKVPIDKLPIGGHELKKARKFTTTTYSSHEVKQLFLCSDGYQDQFGGYEGRKFMTKRFRELLQEIVSLPAEHQCLVLEKTYEDWTKGGQYSQVDDISILGIKINPL